MEVFKKKKKKDFIFNIFCSKKKKKVKFSAVILLPMRLIYLSFLLLLN